MILLFLILYRVAFIALSCDFRAVNSENSEKPVHVLGPLSAGKLHRGSSQCVPQSVYTQAYESSCFTKTLSFKIVNSYDVLSFGSGN